MLYYSVSHFSLSKMCFWWMFTVRKWVIPNDRFIFNMRKMLRLYLCVCICVSQRQKRILGPQELEWQATRIYFLGAGNRTQVPCRSTRALAGWAVYPALIKEIAIKVGRIAWVIPLCLALPAITSSLLFRFFFCPFGFFFSQDILKKIWDVKLPINISA